MEAPNSNTTSSQQQQMLTSLAPPLSLPTSLSKNINLIKPPNLLGSLGVPQPTAATASSDLLNTLPPNRLLTQALAKPPSLNLVLNKPVSSPSPTNLTPNSHMPTSVLSMPKNVLSNGQMNLNSSPLMMGSNLIAQSVKSAELSNASTPPPPSLTPSLLTNNINYNNNSSASSLNSSTADLTQSSTNSTTTTTTNSNTNNQFNLANSMPTANAAQLFSNLPTPSSFKQNDLQTQQQQFNSQLFQPQNSPAKLSQSLNHIQSNDLFNSNNLQQQPPTTAPINQQNMSYFQQQSQQTPSTNYVAPPQPPQPSQPSPANYFQQNQSVSSPPSADPFRINSNKLNEQQPATAPISSVPFFSSLPQQNTVNSTPPLQQQQPPPPVQSTSNLFSQQPPQQMNQTPFQQNTTNYFPPQTKPQPSQPQTQPPLKTLNQSATSYFPTPNPTPPPNSAPIQQPQVPFYAPPPPQQQNQQLPPPQPTTFQNGPSYFNNNNNTNYQSPPPPPPPKSEATNQPYLFNPSAQSSQLPLPPPSYNNNNNNTSYSSNIRPPPTASELQQQNQFNPSNYSQLPNQMSQMNLSSTSSNASNLNQQQQQQQQPSTSSLLSQSSQSRQSQYSSSSSNANYSSPKTNYFINRSQPHSVDLLREKRLISEFPDADEIVRPQFPHEFYTMVNCHHDTIRCTLTAIPESQSLLSKCRLPLGILIHPFKDLESLKVVQSSTIVRCRNCRSYINPFVHFLDNSKWRCNMCYSINDLPDEFLFDPVTRSYGDPSKRPEINSSTIEFIAPAEYTLRPPPPAMYLYLLDVSHNAIATGYLSSFCEALLENLDKIPGDSRTQIGFITYNSSLHFYNLSESLSQPRMMIYPDLEELVLPLPDNLMVNLNENRSAIQLFLQALPSMFADAYETDSALGMALTAGYQLLKHTGGRITIMQTCLPSSGIGSLKTRDESIDKDSTNLGPQTDFYKKMALDCAGVHIAVDLFMFNSLYADLATLSCVSKYSGGEIKYYPGFHVENHPEQVIRFCVDFKRYLIRKIGFEAVMRIRCTRGLAIHTFHGNFFVRSTDLLALPNVNPDAGFGMQVAIEENLTDINTVCFQAAVLYTSSKGERRIRIHTYCLPVSKNLNELINGADQEAIVGLVAKMAVDRTAMSSLKEAKDALMNVAVDYLQSYSQLIVASQRQSALLSPVSLRLIPTYILALMKNIAFKFGPQVKMDDRVYAMNLHKTMPLKYLMLCIYPHLYAIHNLDDRKVIVDSSETEICIPPRLHLSSENIDRHGVYIMDAGEAIYMWIGRSVSDQFLQMVFDCKSFQELPDHSNDLPELDNILSERVRNFLVYLYDSRPFGPTFMYFREDSSKSKLFFQHMHDDKTESSISYYEFLRHLNEQISS